MHIFNEQLMALFHLSDADRISLAESKMISAMTASTPYSGRPVGVIMVITPATAEYETVVVAAIVVDIVLISMIQSLFIMLH